MPTRSTDRRPSGIARFDPVRVDPATSVLRQIGGTRLADVRQPSKTARRAGL